MEDMRFNAERYSDPTVYRALKNIEREDRIRELKKERMRRRNAKKRKKRKKEGRS